MRASPQLKRISKARSRTRGVFSALVRKKTALVGFVIVLGFLLLTAIVSIFGLLGLMVTPYDPIKQDVGPKLAPPSSSHIFGTDVLGRDVFSRILAATPNDVNISLAVIAFASAVGAIVGSYAAFRGGFIDEALMRTTDVFFGLPVLVLAMAISIALGRGLVNMMIALMITWWPPYARMARGEALRVSHMNYIEAARLSGSGRLKILLKHVLPNILTTMLVYATLDIGTVILVYSGLSYLGLSIRPPEPDWGEMVSSYQGYLLSAPWLPLIPGFVIALGAIGFGLLGDGLREWLGVS